MAGEQSQSEVTAENFPLHFAIANNYGGSVHAFDVYQGPYIKVSLGGKWHKLWLSSGEVEGYAVIYNETLDRKSSEFWGGVYFKPGTREVDEEREVADVLRAAEQALTAPVEGAKKWKVPISAEVTHTAVLEVEAVTLEEARELALNFDGPLNWKPAWASITETRYGTPEEVTG